MAQAERPGGCWHLASHLQLRVQPQVSGAHDITAFVYRRSGGGGRKSRRSGWLEGDPFPTPGSSQSLPCPRNPAPLFRPPPRSLSICTQDPNLNPHSPLTPSLPSAPRTLSPLLVPTPSPNSASRTPARHFHSPTAPTPSASAPATPPRLLDLPPLPIGCRVRLLGRGPGPAPDPRATPLPDPAPRPRTPRHAPSLDPLSKRPTAASCQTRGARSEALLAPPTPCVL